MDWKNLPPKYLVFDTMEDFGEWLKDHSQDVPLRGEVWFFKSKAEEFVFTYKNIAESLEGKYVSYRKELGGYSYKEQLMEIWKFDQEKYDALADLITLNPENLRQYPLWTLPADSLRKHPYIRNYEPARAIVLFRDNNPPENYTIQALEQAGIINHETASRLSRCAISPAKN